ncbi:PstS family phosphate ABC transporter substrate-binding protein [Actinocorallia sp. API 0066]|uniref:PstS family phosphate ABC transporter substrate-binding protein n=1 Tax=Actinocorallia sp. API 0066 TaxID=2896846 RepID=UPI001E3073F4|nr:PstS family phosphate ABC transporter substrate-binding protein [Actinocorallia sp. API 0066]MCD0449384.1 PstS family phosphate ABC transporter substrate-binding protein [Actinocorallia sp. API 0066]
MTISMRATVRTAAVLSGLALALSACGGGGTDDASGSELSGSVKIDGSSTVAPLTTVASELFTEENGRVQIPVGTSGTGGGFEKFCAGETDISNASRPIKDEEKAACAAKGVKYSEFTVANDALSVVVSKENTWATCLTVEQLKKIWEPGSKVNNWKQIDASFPDEPLKLFGPGTDSGTFDYFTAEINGEEGASRSDFQPSEDDNVIVQGVSGSKGGLGYFGFSYYEENADKLKVLQIDGGAGCVAPSVAAAQDGTYKPLARPLFIYPSAEALKRPEALAFVEYYVGNHAKIAEAAKFVPLNATQETALKQALDALKTQAG